MKCGWRDDEVNKKVKDDYFSNKTKRERLQILMAEIRLYPDTTAIEIIHRHYLRLQPLTVIAREMNIPYSTVCHKHKVALANLRRAVEDAEGRE